MTLKDICGICEQMNETIVSLEVVDVNLTTITIGCFRSCNGLETLSFQNTSLSYLENNSFTKLDSVHTLNLNDNSLIDTKF